MRMTQQPGLGQTGQEPGTLSAPPTRAGLSAVSERGGGTPAKHSDLECQAAFHARPNVSVDGLYK